MPSDICNNTPLPRIISFSVNQLSGKISATIWKCRELEALFLSANHLNGSIPGEIGSLSKLSKLLMGLNDLEASGFDSFLFSNKKYFRDLYNKLTICNI
ncbi:hypothetical protein ACS0TY_028411 [Phlomoides rotata]